MRRYAAAAIALHWLTAAAIFFQLGLAQRMEGPDGPDKFAVFQLHKSVGVTILVLTLLRLAWRLTHKPPPSAVTGWEKRLSAAAHWGFYGLLVILPLTGWLTVSSSRLELPTLLYGVVPFPDLPVPDAIHGAASTSHHLLASVLIGLLLLHVAGALKHQFWRSDEPVMPRMAGPVPWWTIAAAAIAVFAGGVLIKPPAPPLKVVQAGPNGMAAPDLPGANWTIQPGSALTFTAVWTDKLIEGRFSRWGAAIAFDPDNLPASRIRVVVDLTSAATGDAQRDAMLQAADWFDTANHATATFEAASVDKTPIGYVARGTLTMKGISAHFDLPFTLQPGPVTTATAETTLDRSQYAIGQGLGSAQISAQVRVKAVIRAAPK